MLVNWVLNLRSSSSQNGEDSDLLDRLNCGWRWIWLESVTKVRTKWLINQGTDTKHTHHKHSGNIYSFTNLCQYQGTMTGCIVNCYRDNGARTQPQADDESYIDQSSSICTLLLRETSKIWIFTNSHRDPKKLKTFEHHSGSVFMMHSNQTNFSIDGIRYSSS